MGIKLACGDDDVQWIEVRSEYDMADENMDSDPAKNRPDYIRKRGTF